MTVFKTFFKVLNKYKFMVILYTVILVGFAGFNMKTSDNNMTFSATKPNVLIINNDVNFGITQNLVEYIEKNSNIVDIKDSDEARKDALFYREVNYIIYIPKNYRNDFLAGNNPIIDIESTGDYQASLAEMMLERYVKTANIYMENYSSEEVLIRNINETLSKKANIQITSTLDTDNLSQATFFYNFVSYSLLAGCVYVVCMILNSFNEEKIRKRTIISSMNYKKYNRKLLLANGVFALVLWLAYVILSFILVGNVMFEIHGFIYILNSLVFTICSVTIAFLISNLVNNKEAINGIINVVALGSSFLCGAFIPIDFLPDAVIKVAHLLPTYYYINCNEMISGLEKINIDTLKPILGNMGIVLVFSIIFIMISNIVSKKKRLIN